MKKHTESNINIPKKRKTDNGKIEITTNLSSKSLSSNWLTFNKITKNGNYCNAQYVEVKNQRTRVNRIQLQNVRKPKVTKVLAMDCEMVSNTNDENLLARVSIVNFNLECLYDKFVKPTEPVGDYRTRVSGVRPSDLNSGEEFSVVQKEVKELLYNKILVGHALSNDFNVLKFGHHWKLIRDTSKFKPFRDISSGKTPSLKKLSKSLLNEVIQEGEHSSVEDARAAMKLYLKYRHDWEQYIFTKINEKKNFYQRNSKVVINS